jgi:integrase/recombinase XerC
MRTTVAYPLSPSISIESPLNPPLYKGGNGIESGFGEWLAEQNSSLKTIQAYLSDFHQYEMWFANYYGEDFTPEKLTSHDLRTWRDHTLNREQRSPSTWNRRKASLSVYCQYAREIGAISHDPTRGLQSAEAVSLPPRWLDAIEYGRVIRWMEHAVDRANTTQQKDDARRNVAMAGLMLFAALREGEVVALRYTDITISERKGKAVVHGKGQKLRNVPLSLEAREALKPYLNPPISPFEKGDKAEGYLFPISPRQIQNIVGDIGREAQVEDLTPHRFRHTAIKRMLDAGMDPIAVQFVAGHAKFSTTAGYAKPGWDDLERAVEGVAIGKVR